MLQNLGIFLDFAIPLCMIVVHTVFEEFLKLRERARHAPGTSAPTQPEVAHANPAPHA